MADRDDNDLQNAVVDFVNHPVISDANPPRIATREFLDVCRARVDSNPAKRASIRFAMSSGKRSSSLRTDLGRMTRYLI